MNDKYLHHTSSTTKKMKTKSIYVLNVQSNTNKKKTVIVIQYLYYSMYPGGFLSFSWISASTSSMLGDWGKSGLVFFVNENKQKEQKKK